MDFERLKTELSSLFPESLEMYVQFGCNFIRAKDADTYKELLKKLNNDFSFKYIVDIAATHWPENDNKFEVTVNIFSIQNKLRVFVKLSRPDNIFPSITDIWRGADFLEREEYDLMGIVFEGHPDLRRILLPDYFEGHPLRKDFPLKERKWFNNADEQKQGLRFSK